MISDELREALDLQREALQLQVTAALRQAELWRSLYLAERERNNTDHA